MQSVLPGVHFCVVAETKILLFLANHYSSSVLLVVTVSYKQHWWQRTIPS